MQKRILLFLAIILNAVVGFSQLNINLIANYTYTVAQGELNDIWGYVDTTGKEYALVGLNEGVSIMDISTPSAPVQVFWSSGASSIWRDLKVWNKHLYITNESANGVKIIDMSNLPGAITTGDVYQFAGSTYPFNSAHNLYIDENGIAYIFGADNGVGGAIILDLNPNPNAPVELGRYNDYYLHDGMARGDTLWGAAINDGFFTVVDVSNKATPSTMQTQATPSFFTHNCWVSDDGHTLYTTDEKPNGFIGAYDVSNLSNISETDRVQSSPGMSVIPHNVHFMNNYVITSYYRDGVKIHDVSNPNNIIEVGNYDTSPQLSGDGYNGCWGVYPWLPSGLIIASDIENGLFVLGPTYTPAAFLDGNVTDSVTTFALNSVQVDIVSTTTTTNTNIIGDYQTGIVTAGTYSVTYTKAGYEPKTISGVVLTSGSTTTLNVELKPLVPFTLLGQVIESATSNPIANANVFISNSLFNTTVQTDGAGNFSVPNFYQDNYDVFIGKWGYNQLCLSNQSLSSLGNTYVYQLTDGYYDDFTFDLGWTVSGSPSSGDWVRGVPVGTTNGFDIANPDEDSQSDCTDEAYITGNGGGSAGTDDIDGGETLLTSPIFDLSTYTDPYIHFDRWFYNGGGFGTPNDSLVVELSNGSSTVKIDYATVNDAGLSTWASKGIHVSSITTPTSTMQLIVRAMDQAPGHVTEAGFDKFLVVDSAASTIDAINGSKNEVFIYPNPFNDEVNIHLSRSYKSLRIEIYEITGKLIAHQVFNNALNVQIKNNFKSGIYFIKIIGDGVLIQTQKMIKL